jgi:AraC family transcriptional regulator, transcriptional activator FtrA
MNTKSHKVAILSFDNAAFFELGCAIELFGLPRPEFANWYECEVVSFDKGPLAYTAGVQLLVKQVRNLDRYSMLVVPSWASEQRSIPPALAKAIVKFHQQGKRILSFCSGAFLLAELGLLKHCRATTHWRYAAKFKQRFPDSDYVEDVLYVYDGTIGCSAGSASAIDLGIEVIRQDYGYHCANQVARRLVMSAHRQGGQSQFVETPLLHASDHFSAALDWAIKHLASPLSVDGLARKADMSRRTFDRKFRSTFNLSPLTWLTQQRVQLAKHLLEDGKYGIDKVAEKAGFNNAMTLRHHFQRTVGVTPSRYREQFVSAKSRSPSALGSH